MRNIHLLLLLFLFTGCDQAPLDETVSISYTQRGISLFVNQTSEYETIRLNTTIDQIKAVGVTHVALLVISKQQGVSLNEMTVQSRTELAVLREAIQQAKRNNIEVVLKPHIEVNGGVWRGKIVPEDVSLWFQNYRSFLGPIIDLAAEENVSQLIIGTELAGVSKHTSKWLDLIRFAREKYQGKISYAASWDEAEIVTFWDELDYIGVNAYYPITGRTGATRQEMLAGWQQWLTRLKALHQKTGKQILLTEIGYRSVDGAGMNPFDFTSFAEVDQNEQADLYWAALYATGDLDWIEGLYWWNWMVAGTSNYAKDYTPAGKKAENVLRSFWSPVDD